MTKILFITNIAKKIGSFSIASINAAKKQGFDFHMAAFWNLTSAEMIHLENDHSIKLHHVNLVRSPFSLRNYKAYKQIVKIIREEHIDYIHCNTPVGGILGRLAGKKCKVKRVIYQAHGFHFYKGAPKKNWLFYYPIEKWLARYTDALITINQEDYELAKAKFKLRNHGKVYYVPGVGINTSDYHTDEATRIAKREELGLPSDAFLLVSAGELNANKNNRVIISAMEKLHDKRIHYILCGVGDQQSALEAQASAAGLSENVHFLGYRTDVKELYQAADAFVMPSLREGLSRSIMEAMASGLPCIVSKIRGNVDLVTNSEGGFLCKPTDPDEFASAIGALLNDPELCQQMKRYNQEKIKNFDTAIVETMIKNIYSEDQNSK